MSVLVVITYMYCQWRKLEFCDDHLAAACEINHYQDGEISAAKQRPVNWYA